MSASGMRLAGLLLFFAASVQAQNVTVIRNATILTITNGVIEHGTVVLRGSKIAAVGPDASTPAPAGAKIIDGTGKYVMPGIIDTHSHTSIEGSVNELSLPNTDRKSVV